MREEDTGNEDNKERTYKRLSSMWGKMHEDTYIVYCW
jgi:hypothetical protein